MLSFFRYVGQTHLFVVCLLCSSVVWLRYGARVRSCRYASSAWPAHRNRNEHLLYVSNMEVSPKIDGVLCAQNLIFQNASVNNGLLRISVRL